MCVPVDALPPASEADKIKQILRLLEIALTSGDGSTFAELIEQLRITGFGQAALLDSKEAWKAMEQAYEQLLPNGPLLDFFWSWRFLVRSLLAVMSTPLPQARVFHAAATGFSGLVGSYAKLVAKMPLLVTEHGIYTNERRMDLAVADWLFNSEAGGFDVAAETGRAALDLVERISILLAHQLCGSRCHNHYVPRQSVVSTLLTARRTTSFASSPTALTPRNSRLSREIRRRGRRRW